MSTHKHIDKLCAVILLLTLLITIAFANGEALGITIFHSECEYEALLFDTSRVHTIDIIMDDWDSFIKSCADEKYTVCTVVIDNERIKNAAIRAKGNTSLTQVAAYGNDRYSFKIEFDHYDSTASYHGLDKLCLNNIISDNTYMKDYLCYQMMSYIGTAAPLASYAYITVNGQEFGLYLAVEAIEDAFLERNFGKDHGELYKPDSESMGGGMAHAGGDLQDDRGGHGLQSFGKDMGDIPFSENDRGGQAGGFALQSDLLLQYTDNSYESYSNIFDNSKTAITSEDKDRLIAALKRLTYREAISDTVDIESVIKYFVAHNFVLNFDSYTGSMIHNYYLYEKNGQLMMIPWDYNLAFGGFGGASDATALVNYPIDEPTSNGALDTRPMLSWIFASEEYTNLYHRYFEEFIHDYFSSGYFESMIDELYSLIAPFVEKDPTKFCSYDEFEKGVATLKAFCLLRAESISAQLDGTIGSTSDGQKSSELIDASEIQINDMGTMNMGNGDAPSAGDIPNGGFQGGGLPNGNGQSGDIPSGDLPNGNIPSGDTNGGNMPNGGFQGGGMPNDRFQIDQSGEKADDTHSGELVLLLMSAAVLAFGIIFARSWGKRKSKALRR